MFFTIYRLTLLFSILFWVKASQAFCIYNTFTDGTLLFVHQYDNYGDEVMDNDTKFRAEIKAGEKACCNWTDSTCNYKGTQDALNRFVIWTGFSNNGRIGLDMLYVYSAGFSKVGGDPIHPTIQSYFPDGRPYTYFGGPESEDFSDYY